MAVVLGLSISILVWALAVALRGLRRTGEARMALVAGLVALLCLVAGALLAENPARPLGLDATSAEAAAILAAAGASLLVTRAFDSTLEELDLAEALHWGSMQGVRAVTQLAGAQSGEIAERLAALLELGCERFGLEVGIVARVDGDQYEIRALHAPDGFPVAAGAILRLEETLCRHTLAAERPVAVEQVSAAAWARPTDANPLGLEAYLGAAVTAAGRPFGTLVFGSLRTRPQRFTASHKDLLALMAHWVGVEIDRREGPVADATAEVALPPLPAPRARTARADIDLNAALRRVERRIRDLVEPRVQLVVRASDEPALARHPGVPPDSLLLTLVGHAIEAMPGGGTLVLSSARLEGGPTRWVTLSVSHTGRGPNAQHLARAFASSGDAGRDGRALASLVRAVRRGGGDLSVEIDPARGSTFTVFLPARGGDARAPQPQHASRAPAAPPPPGN